MIYCCWSLNKAYCKSLIWVVEHVTLSLQLSASLVKGCQLVLYGR